MEWRTVLDEFTGHLVHLNEIVYPEYYKEVFGNIFLPCANILYCEDWTLQQNDVSLRKFSNSKNISKRTTVKL